MASEIGDKPAGDTDGLLSETSLIARMSEHPVVRHGAKLDAGIARWRKALQDTPQVADRYRHLGDTYPMLEKLVSGIFSHAPHIRDMIIASPRDFIDHLATVPEERFARLVQQLSEDMSACDHQANAMQLLRVFKRKASLLIGLADIAGVWNMAEVTGALTELADRTTQAAADFLLKIAAAQAKIHLNDPKNPSFRSGWIILAMGKMGAGELNYSSDIDLIIFYDPSCGIVSSPNDAAPFFVRLTKSLVKLLQERNADGYVFRTDLRLRPDPGATAVAVSKNAALQYYESLGQNWERAALIKARAVAGDVEAGNRFLAEIAPFVWRKYFDFAALSDVHAMKRQIHTHKGHGEIALNGHNIKLGRGGIREIEFFVQTQQLIAGGRQPCLRGRRTVDMLATLYSERWITRAARDELTQAYWFLRRVEHRLQMRQDEQTHDLPTDPIVLEDFALFCGFADLDSFAQQLLAHLRRVQAHYAALFEEEDALGAGGDLVFTGSDDDPATLENLSRMGFEHPSEICRQVRSWHFGRYPAMRSAKAREKLTRMIPTLLAALAKTGNPQNAFNAFDQFLSQLPTGVQLFSMLQANPQLLQLMARIMGTAPRLAEMLSHRPRLADGLLDPERFVSEDNQAELNAQLTQSLAEAHSHEEILDRARRFGQEQQFLVAVRLISQLIDAEPAADRYTALADMLVGTLFDAARQHLVKSHGDLPGEVVILAMGKWGGGELMLGSDLDLQLIYSVGSDSAQSDGDKPLSPSVYFARLTQRLISAISAPTGEGRLYEVDMRLRPSGNAGPVATRIDSFADYHGTESWTWEHMALTRARIIRGEPALSQQVDSIIADTLRRQRDPSAIASDVIDMRKRMHEEKGADTAWSVKMAPGGVVDVEFIVQFLQLIHANRNPHILARNSRQAISALAQAGLLKETDCEILLTAHQLYHRLAQLLRLSLGDSFVVGSANDMPADLMRLLANMCETPDIDALADLLKRTQAQVREIFSRVVGGNPWA